MLSLCSLFAMALAWDGIVVPGACMALRPCVTPRNVVLFDLVMSKSNSAHVGLVPGISFSPAPSASFVDLGGLAKALILDLVQSSGQRRGGSLGFLAFPT